MENTKKTALGPNKPPYGNYILVLLMADIFALQFLGDPKMIYLQGLILGETSLTGMLGYFWLHSGAAHIIINILFLAGFGRKICNKIGHTKYVLIYFILGFTVAAVHLLVDGKPVIGSSGAIFGVMGLAVVLSWRKLSPMAPWIILTWLILSIALAATGTAKIAYVAHIAGFIAGMIIGIALIFFDQADRTDTDQSLVAMAIVARKSYPRLFPTS